MVTAVVTSLVILLGTLASLPLALVLSFCLVPSVSSSIFRSWQCNEYQFDGSTDSNVVTHEYLANDLSVRCSSGGFTSDEYETITSIAIAFVLVWPVGTLLLEHLITDD